MIKTKLNNIYLFLNTHKKWIMKVFLGILLFVILSFIIISLTSCGGNGVTNVASTTNAQQDLQKAMDAVNQQQAIIQQKQEQLKKQEEISQEQKKLVQMAEQKLTEELKQKQIKEQKHQIALQAVKKYRAEKDILQEKLNAIIKNAHSESLNTVLKSKESGGHGIYILHNETNNKFYIGQAKQCIKRIKQHFNVEDLAKDYLKGDHFMVQIIPSRELPKDYELSHMEKAAIQMFKKDKHLYNKTDGNLVYLDDNLDFDSKDLAN